MSASVEQIVRLFEEKGDSEYGGEPVTQIQHALQCALLAEQDSASPSLITASLLHDVGHLLHALPDDAPDQGIDDAHEDLGYRYLTQLFGDAVSEPVRLHVPAKRYLCTTDESYYDKLSEPSVVSLGLQGGKMSQEELDQFEANPHYREAVRLRRWDDEAKVVDLETPPLEHFVSYLRTSLK